MNDATYFRIAAKRGRFTTMIAAAMKLPWEAQINVVRDKRYPLMYRVAALRNIVCDSEVGLGYTYLSKRRLVRKTLGI